MGNLAFRNSCKNNVQTCRCFNKLTKSETDLILTNQVELSFKKGEVICKQGSIVPHVILLTSGLAKAYIEYGKSNLVLKIVSGGKFIALSSAMEGDSFFHYSAQAYIDSSAMFIDLNV